MREGELKFEHCWRKMRTSLTRQGLELLLPHGDKGSELALFLPFYCIHRVSPSSLVEDHPVPPGSAGLRDCLPSGLEEFAEHLTDKITWICS